MPPEQRAGETQIVVPDPVEPFVVATNPANGIPVGLKVLLPGFQRALIIAAVQEPILVDAEVILILEQFTIMPETRIGKDVLAHERLAHIVVGEALDQLCVDDVVQETRPVVLQEPPNRGESEFQVRQVLEHADAHDAVEGFPD